MARRRPPVPCDLPFIYWVFGRPVSIQNEDGSKPAALARWRGSAATALAETVDAASRRRGFVPIEGPVAIRLVWLSIDPSDPSQPDLDNILKPLIDAFNTRVVADDRQVHAIHAMKASINRPPAWIADRMAEIEDDPRFLSVAEVTIVRLDHLTSDERA